MSKDTDPPEIQLAGDLITVLGICRRRLGTTIIVLLALIAPNITGAASMFSNNKSSVATITKDQAATMIDELGKLNTSMLKMRSDFNSHQITAADKFQDVHFDILDLKKDIREKD